MLEMPVLETTRLLIRPFQMTDLPEVIRLLDAGIESETLHTESYTAAARREWLQWTVLNYHQLALLNQPPYGDRAVVFKTSGELAGACGFVPCLDVFEQLPNFPYHTGTDQPGLATAELGLFYAVYPEYRRQGIAAEAAQALVDYAFGKMRIRRIIATTDFDNAGSIGVMKRLGMRIAHNPQPTPSWLQVVGVLERDQWDR